MTPPLPIHQPDAATIGRAVELLRHGELVVMPTETVYGLGAHALDPVAVAGIFEAKGRPRFDPLIVHTLDADAARALTTAWPGAAQKLADALWPGPLTLVLPKADGVPDLVTAGLGTVALRVPAHPVARRLLRAAGLPIAAPSANRFGGVSPTTAQHAAEELGDRVPLILDGGPCAAGVESTVVSLVNQTPTLLRPGATPTERIEAIVGPLAAPQPTGESEHQGKASPGMLDRHYAPHTELRLVDDLARVDPAQYTGRRVGILSLTDTLGYPGPISAHQPLAPNAVHNDMLLTAAAARLFAAVRALDTAGVEVILAQRVPDHGLGRAINDRLTRAATR